MTTATQTTRATGKGTATLPSRQAEEVKDVDRAKVAIYICALIEELVIDEAATRAARSKDRQARLCWLAESPSLNLACLAYLLIVDEPRPEGTHPRWRQPIGVVVPERRSQVRTLAEQARARGDGAGSSI